MLVTCVSVFSAHPKFCSLSVTEGQDWPEETAGALRVLRGPACPPTCSCCALSRVISFSTSQMWLVALATSARSRSRSASNCSMCCCFSFSASCKAVVPEILRA